MIYYENKFRKIKALLVLRESKMNLFLPWMLNFSNVSAADSCTLLTCGGGANCSAPPTEVNSVSQPLALLHHPHLVILSSLRKSPVSLLQYRTPL